MVIKEGGGINNNLNLGGLAKISEGHSLLALPTYPRLTDTKQRVRVEFLQGAVGILPYFI